MKRQEFTKPVSREILKRATVDGVVRCEQCGLACKKFHIDHIIADGLKPDEDKVKPLTADDGQLLCMDAGRQSCHGRKTAENDVPKIAKAKRVADKRHSGMREAPKRPLESKGFTPPDKSGKAASKKVSLPPRSLFVSDPNYRGGRR